MGDNSDRYDVFLLMGRSGMALQGEAMDQMRPNVVVFLCLVAGWRVRPGLPI